MSKKNNKGFTMMEILGAVAILGIIMLLAVPSVTKLMKRFKNDYYVELEETLTATAKDFYSDNKIYRPNGLLKSSYTKMDTLVNKNYIDELKDYKGKSCSLNESYIIVVYRGNGKYEYNSCLKCDGDKYESENENTYCDPAWLTNDNIGYDYGDSNTVYVYKDARKEEVREKLLKSVNVVKYNADGEVLDRIKLAESKEDNLLPYDIDDLDTSVVNSSTNMKTTTLHYKYENQTDELDVVVYKHFKPQVKLYTNNNGGTSIGYIPGTWTNNLTIHLFKNQYDEFFDLSNTSVKKYQVSIDNGEWQDVICDMTIDGDGCGFVINKNVNAGYKFRLVTNEGKLSDETITYPIKVDVDKPTVSINPNGDEPIVVVGSTKGNLNFTLTTDETGPESTRSGIKTRKYAISTSGTTAPSSFTAFYNNTFDYSQEKEGNIYYVWSKVEDNAGNVSTEVWPSEKFRMKYEVVYDANGGEGAPSTQYKKHGSNLTLSTTTPTRTGYTFEGWSTTATGSVEYTKGATYKDNKAIRLYAVWKANILTVNYYSNYATSAFSGALNTVGANLNVKVRTVTYVYDAEYPNGLWDYSYSGATTYLGRTGYTATGNWGTTTSGGTLVNENTSFDSGQALAEALGKDLSNGDATINVYAQWEANVLTVNYYSNYATSAFSEALNTVGANLNVKVRTTTHEYDGDCSDGLWNYSYSTASTYLGRTGYTATRNWGTTTSGGTLVNESTSFTTCQALAQALGKDLSNGNAEINVYAQWRANVLTVNYYSNYATSAFSTALNTVGSNLNVKVRTTTHAYNTEYSDGLWNYSTSGSTTYLARAGYTATGNWGTTTSGGTLVNENTSFDSGQALAQALGKDLSNGDATINVYAQWRSNVLTFIYHANEGTTGSNAEYFLEHEYTRKYSSGAQDPINFSSFDLSRTGYSRKDGYEWNTSADGTGTSFDQDQSYDLTRYSSLIETQDVTVHLYAQWTVNQYTVTFDSNGGSAASPQTITKNYDTAIGTLPTTSRTGYTFKGWYTAKSGGTQITTSTKVKSNQTYYAQWRANVLTVNYYSNYATSAFSTALNTVGSNLNVKVRTTTHAYNTEYSDGLWNYSTSGSTTYLARAGYTATGNWGTTTSGGTLVNENTSFDSGQALAQALGKDLSNGDATINVYAQWRSNVLTIIYHANGGTTGANARYFLEHEYTRSYSSGAQDPINFSSFVLDKSGYSRKDGAEWNTRADGTGTSFDQDQSYDLTIYSSLIETQDVTVHLYAQWVKNESGKHTHSCETRSYGSGYGDSVKDVLKYWPVNDHNHWCSNSSKSETCIPSNYTGSETIPMYQVTCEICGKSCDQRWCPVHAAGGSKTSGGGGKNLEICDASAKKYSSGATKCVGKTNSSLGWTQVSK